MKHPHVMVIKSKPMWRNVGSQKHLIQLCVSLRVTCTLQSFKNISSLSLQMDVNLFIDKVNPRNHLRQVMLPIKHPKNGYAIVCMLGIPSFIRPKWPQTNSTFLQQIQQNQHWSKPFWQPMRRFSLTVGTKQTPRECMKNDPRNDVSYFVFHFVWCHFGLWKDVISSSHPLET